MEIVESKGLGLNIFQFGFEVYHLKRDDLALSHYFVVIENVFITCLFRCSSGRFTMEDQEFVDVQISGWWGVATVLFVVAGGAMIIAKMIGLEAIDMLINTSLIAIFMCGGILLGLLTIQALGASQLWGLGTEEAASPSVEAAHKKHSTSLAEFENDLEPSNETFDTDDDIDPFYEIMKQNRSSNFAA